MGDNDEVYSGQDLGDEVQPGERWVGQGWTGDNGNNSQPEWSTWQDYAPLDPADIAAHNASVDARQALPVSSGGNNSGTKSAKAGGGGSAIPTQTFGYPTSMPAPYVPAAYTPPAWDKRQVAYQTQKAAAPYVGEIRRAIRQAITRSNVSGNPIMSRYESGAALDAAGGAFGKVMGQAGDTGLKNYSAEYGRDLNAYNMNYNTNQQAAMANYTQKLAMFNQALAAYYKSPGLGGPAGDVNSSYPSQSNDAWNIRNYG